MVLSGGQSPGARRSRHRPRGAPLPSLPRTGSPCGPGPPPAFTRSPGTGVIRLLCCHRWCRNRLRAPVAPAPPQPSRSPGRGRHVGTGPGRWRRCALTCRRCCCCGGCGGGTTGQPWPWSPRRRRLCLSLLLLLLPPRSVSPARRRRRGFSCPVTLRSHDRESGATSAKRLRAAPAGGERRRESSGGKSPLRPPSRLPSPRPPPPPAALPPPPPPAALTTLPLPPRLRSAPAKLLQTMCSRGEETSLHLLGLEA
ncbi:formin-like protein 3 [Ursus americanus]|uniref:formin-like protein 3 n=1 Tax=Ursus americanus TaxID=9643 RepID=UPI001E67B92D|nr:formin-like protein 3 [Ursus americanus]